MGCGRRNVSAPTPGSATADRCQTAPSHCLCRQGAARCLLCLSACLQRRLGRSHSGSVRGPRQRSPGAGATRVSDGFRGTPTTRQRWWGRERSDRIRARSAAMGEGAQRPKGCRLCRPPKRSEVPSPLMPFPFVRRIWSFSGRSAGFLLVHQGKVAPTTSFLPDHLWFLLLGGRGGVALVCAG